MKSAATHRPIEKLVACDRPIDPAVAEQVGQEIIQNRLEPGAWANALAASGGKRGAGGFGTERRQDTSAGSAGLPRRLPCCLLLPTGCKRGFLAGPSTNPADRPSGKTR